MTSADEKPAPIIFGDESISDVTLVVGDQDFRIHKIVLASRSDVFKAMFYGDFKESKQDRIEIKDVSADNFRRFLEIIYNGKIRDHGFLIFPFIGKRGHDHVAIKCKYLDSDKNTKEVRYVESHEKYFHNFWKNTTEILNIADRFNLFAPIKYYLKTMFDRGFHCTNSECNICFNVEILGILYEMHNGTVKHRYDYSVFLEWLEYAQKEPFPTSIPTEKLPKIMETINRYQ